MRGRGNSRRPAAARPVFFCVRDSAVLVIAPSSDMDLTPCLHSFPGIPAAAVLTRKPAFRHTGRALPSAPATTASLQCRCTTANDQSRSKVEVQPYASSCWRQGLRHHDSQKNLRIYGLPLCDSPTTRSMQDRHSLTHVAALAAVLAAAALCPDAANAWQIRQEPSNALSLPTWAIHVSSVYEWGLAMGLMWKYADVTGMITEFQLWDMLDL